eukprot:3952945-Amphidinium_carterae.1
MTAYTTQQMLSTGCQSCWFIDCVLFGGCSKVHQIHNWGNCRLPPKPDPRDGKLCRVTLSYCSCEVVVSSGLGR